MIFPWIARVVFFFRRMPALAALLLLVAVAIAACQSTVPPVPHVGEATVLVNSVFLIGDTGKFDLPPDSLAATTTSGPVLTALAADIADRCRLIGTEQTTVIFLGDNVYPDGLAPQDHPDRARGESILQATIAALGLARGIFTMGNHDWQHGGPDRLEWVREQGRYLNAYNANIEVHPMASCPGPSRVDIGEHLRFLFLDPAALNYWKNHPRDGCPCENKSNKETYEHLREEFENTDDRFVIFASHYPTITVGPHGGEFGWVEHLFPLRDKNPKLWIPLPIIGTIYALTRRANPSDGDIRSGIHQEFLRNLQDQFVDHVPNMVVAGHEHSLQIHLDDDGRFHIVSGAGVRSKITPVRKSHTAVLALRKAGYMRLDVFESGFIRLIVITVDRHGNRTEVSETWVGRSELNTRRDKRAP